MRIPEKRFFSRGLFVSAVVIVSMLFAAQAQDTLLAAAAAQGADREKAASLAAAKAAEKVILNVLATALERDAFAQRRKSLIEDALECAIHTDTITVDSLNDTTATCSLSLVINSDELNDVLMRKRIVIAGMRKPRLLLLAWTPTRGPPPGRIEWAMIQRCARRHGFSCVDPSAARSIRASRRDMEQIAADPAVVAAHGIRHGAEVAVVAIVTDTGGIRLSAVNCVTGVLMAEATEPLADELRAEESVLHAVVERACTKLVDPVVRFWREQLDRGMAFTVTIAGVQTRGIRRGVMRTFESLQDVSSVNVTSWEPERSLLVLEIMYRGNAARFCSRIDGFKLRTGSGSLSVAGLKGNRVSVVYQSM